MLCLDTNILVGLMRGDPNLKESFEKTSDEDIAVTPINLCELFKGANLYSRPEEELKKIADAVSNLELLDFSHEACSLFGSLYARLQVIGKQPPEADLMIACIALSHGASIVTRNPSDFRNIPGLDVIVW